jgi:hypothetical protein
MGDDKDKRRGGRSPGLIGTAFRTGAKAISTASTALKSDPVRRLRGGIKTMAGGLVGVGRFVRSNSLRGLLAGQVVVTEGELNRWFSRVDPPDTVAHMALRCRPSRLVLVLGVERRLLGVPLGKNTVDLPFEIEHVDISAHHGEIVLRLDRVAAPEARGLLPSIVKRLLSRAAADLLDEKSPLDLLDVGTDVVRREGNRLVIDVTAYPPFAILMNRELRLLGGHSLFPFRALGVQGARVEEGRLLVHFRLDPELIPVRRVQADLDAFDAENAQVPVQIVPRGGDEDDWDDDDWDDDEDEDESEYDDEHGAGDDRDE